MESQLIKHGSGRELAVILHGMWGSPEKMKGVAAAIGEQSPDMDILVPVLPYAGRLGVFSLTPIEEIVQDLVNDIDRMIADRKERVDGGVYERIIIVGHSYGAALARKIAIVVHGETKEAPFIEKLKHLEKPWAGRIERIILLAGMSRGWAPEIARNWLESLQLTIYSWYCAIVRPPGPTLYAIRVGQPFIVQTRLEWLALTRSRASILVVQMLGAVDDLVSPDDAVDLAVDDGSFILLETPSTGHGTAIEMRRPIQAERTKLDDALAREHTIDGGVQSLADVCLRFELTKQARFMLLSKAVKESREELKEIAIKRDHMADTPATAPDMETKHVVFVIHGIRDKGFWTHKIARAIKKEGAESNEHMFRSFTGTYGYFAMFPFVVPWVRQWKTGWLMDHYVLMRARYPNARFSYVGHSNGTYLLAHALKAYPAAKFHRVVFAGSVVRCDYQWSNFLSDESSGRRGQVDEVLNYVATKDWVVAILSKAFQFTLFDLGSAGYDGFGKEYKPATRPKNLHEAKYIVGKHDAGIKETQWDDIARFIVRGDLPTSDVPKDEPPEWSPDQPKWLRKASSKSWVLLIVVAILAALFVLSLGTIIALAWPYVIYCVVVYLVFTRF